MKKIIIAIDGPAGSGKSTTAKFVAQRLGYIYIDTGAMYRTVTLAWMRKFPLVDKEKELNRIISSYQQNPNNAEQTANNPFFQLTEEINIELINTSNGQKTLLDGEDVSEEIRTPDVTKYVSPVSAIAVVRERMTNIQRKIGENGGVVMDGRDIGTVVFPNAQLKIYLIASIEARALRRSLELKEKGIMVNVDELKQQIIERDKYDSSRNISPLRKAEDAIEIDTSYITIEEQTEKVIKLALDFIK